MADPRPNSHLRSHEEKVDPETWALERLNNILHEIISAPWKDRIGAGGEEIRLTLNQSLTVPKHVALQWAEIATLDRDMLGDKIQIPQTSPQNKRERALEVLANVVAIGMFAARNKNSNRAQETQDYYAQYEAMYNEPGLQKFCAMADAKLITMEESLEEKEFSILQYNHLVLGIKIIRTTLGEIQQYLDKITTALSDENKMAPPIDNSRKVFVQSAVQFLTNTLSRIAMATSEAEIEIPLYKKTWYDVFEKICDVLPIFTTRDRACIGENFNMFCDIETDLKGITKDKEIKFDIQALFALFTLGVHPITDIMLPVHTQVELKQVTDHTHAEQESEDATENVSQSTILSRINPSAPKKRPEIGPFATFKKMRDQITENPKSIGVSTLAMIVSFVFPPVGIGIAGAKTLHGLITTAIEIMKMNQDTDTRLEAHKKELHDLELLFKKCSPPTHAESNSADAKNDAVIPATTTVRKPSM